MLVHLAKVVYTNLFRKLNYWSDDIDSPPLSVLFPTIGIRAGPSEEAWSLEGRSIIMSNQESVGSIRSQIFDGRNFVYWKIITTTLYKHLEWMSGKSWNKEDIYFHQKFLKIRQVKSNMKPMPGLSIHYWQVCHNQSLSKLCSPG